MYKLQLRRIEVSETIFNRILEKNNYLINKVKNIKEFYFGKIDPDFGTNIIYYNGYDEMVMPEYLMMDGNRNYIFQDNYCQVVVRKDPNLNGVEYISNITGFRAYKKLYKILLSFYSETELEARFKLFCAKYDDSKKQLHYILTNTSDTILKFDPVVKYDINGAHCDALLEIFPAAKEALIKIYKDRKKDQQNKNLINYFVGYLCRAGHRDTYNWIVQRTTNIMNKAIKKVGGELIYVNTDGFAVYKPAKEMNISKELGDFKEEYRGPVYAYVGKNYYIYKFGDEFKGSSLKMVRDKFDLENGIVVDYERLIDSKAKIYIAQNVKTRRVGIYDISEKRYY